MLKATPQVFAIKQTHTHTHTAKDIHQSLTQNNNL